MPHTALFGREVSGSAEVQPQAQSQKFRLVVDQAGHQIAMRITCEDRHPTEPAAIDDGEMAGQSATGEVKEGDSSRTAAVQEGEEGGEAQGAGWTVQKVLGAAWCRGRAQARRKLAC